MLCMVPGFLFFDTTVFLIIALMLAISDRRAKRPYRQRHVPRTVRLLLLALFPWVMLLLWLEKPVAKMRRRNRRLYTVCSLFFIMATMLLIALGIFLQNTALSDWGAIAHIWLVILNALVVRGEQNGGNDTNHDDQPPPDDPTPTGDAAENWLRSRRPLTDETLQPILSQ